MSAIPEDPADMPQPGDANYWRVQGEVASAIAVQARHNDMTGIIRNRNWALTHWGEHGVYDLVAMMLLALHMCCPENMREKDAPHVPDLERLVPGDEQEDTVADNRKSVAQALRKALVLPDHTDQRTHLVTALVMGGVDMRDMGMVLAISGLAQTTNPGEEEDKGEEA